MKVIGTTIIIVNIDIDNIKSEIIFLFTFYIFQKNTKLFLLQDILSYISLNK